MTDEPKLASLNDLYASMPGASKGNEPSSTPSAAAPVEPPAPAPKQGDDDWKELTHPSADKGGAATAKTAEPEKPAPKPQAKTEKENDDGEPEPEDVVGLKQALRATRQKVRESKAEAARAKELEAQLAREAQARAEIDNHARQMWARLQQVDPEIRAQTEPPDPLVDPAAALHYRDQQISQALQQRDQRYQHEIYMAKLVPSQRFMREKHQDYPEVEAVFAQAANEAQARGDSSLWNAIRAHEFPAEYAYRVGKEIQLRQQIAQAGSLDQYVERLVENKLKEAQPQPPPAAPQNGGSPPQTHQQQRPAPPPSLARVPSVTPRNPAKTFQGITPLSDLYKS